ncbi:caspase family protein [Nonomuraea sp. M3C6]|uniref:Caspase family protein n=1 Tax=Nonomuraea marmarensis TaxID=3351344 RepID=A0ABW7AG26_9ACTN
MSETTRLRVRVVDAAADPQDLDEATARLRAELLELDVVVSAAEAGEAPEGTRAVLSFTLGGLVIALAGTELLGAIVNAVTAWLTRNQHRSVKLDIEGDVLELTGIRAKEQRELTEVWLRRRQVEASPQVGRRMALIVANDEYRDPGLRRLRAPALDAEALARVLGNEAIGGFEVSAMLNEPTAVINEAVEEFFADRRPDDLLLLHFSGHGVKDDSGELYFATPNTKLNRLGATAVSAEFVNRRMGRSRCRSIVLLLDCCYAGAFARGALPRAGADIHVEEQFGGRGRVVITASNALEYAFDGPDLADAQEKSPSVFTSALVEGLETGEADRDQDGYVGIHELYDYIFDKVRTVTPNQTPGKWTFDVQGELVIARRSRPVDRPAPLPTELQEAIDHPIAKIRAGTVEELERLRHSKHAGLALAARLALEGLAQDDSRMVSAAATRTLSPDTPAPAPGPAAVPQVAPSQAAVPQAAPMPAAVRQATPGRVAPVRPAAARVADAPVVEGRAVPIPAPSAQPEAPEAAPLAAAHQGPTPQPVTRTPEQASTAAPEPPPVPPSESQPVVPGPESVTPTPGGPPTSAARGTAAPAAEPAVRDWAARVPRVLALLSALLLIAAPGVGGLPPLRFVDRLQVDYLIWLWLLIAAAVAVGLVRETRARQASLGAAAGLAGLHLGAFANPERMQAVWSLAIIIAGCALVLVAVFMETALAQARGWRAVGAVAGVLTLLMIYIDLSRATDVEEEPGETVPWIAVFGLAGILAVTLIVRVIRQRGAGRIRASTVLSTAATLLVAVAVSSVYISGNSDFPEIPHWMPALLVLLLLAAQAGWERPELLAGAQLTVIAGLLHNLAWVRTEPPFVVLSFLAAVCAATAAYLSRAAEPHSRPAGANLPSE